MNADERIRQRCRAREDYYRTQRTFENALARAEKKLDIAIEERDTAFNERNEALELLRRQQEENARLRALLEQRSE